MDRKVEIERMETAFKRAADKATHGTREERSGRFVIRDEDRSTRSVLQSSKHRGRSLKK